MKYIRNLWSGILIVLFMSFVVSMVFGTSRNAVTQMVEQADLLNGMNNLQNT